MLPGISAIHTCYGNKKEARRRIFYRLSFSWRYLTSYVIMSLNQHHAQEDLEASKADMEHKGKKEDDTHV